MKHYDNLIYEEKENRIFLYLNRPDSRNAISLGLLSDLENAVNYIEENKTGLTLILGAKGKAFCAGADLKERKSMSDEDVHSFLDRLGKLFSKIENLPMPVIAMLQGAALGGGLELALCADFRIASSESVLALPETRLAIIPGAGGTQRLQRIIGMSKAKEMIFSGERMEAPRAREIGLLDYVSPAEYLVKTAEAFSDKFSESSGFAIALAKGAIQQGRGKTMEEALKIERQFYEKTLESEDRKEALAAFSEKRKPEFKGC